MSRATGRSMEEETPTIVRPTRKRKTDQDRRPQRQPRYHVILWNDDDHTYEYVVKMLRELFGHQMEHGFQLAEEVDGRGRAIILTTTKEHAELKCEQIHAYGRDPVIKACSGSMSSTIEPES
ncbi:MAG: ATP-dependent Clp protease adaptor ClpS [Pirellulales bacterium]